jgi:hypothetical protein
MELFKKVTLKAKNTNGLTKNEIRILNKFVIA